MSRISHLSIKGKRTASQLSSLSRLLSISLSFVFLYWHVQIVFEWCARQWEREREVGRQRKPSKGLNSNGSFFYWILYVEIVSSCLQTSHYLLFLYTQTVKTTVRCVLEWFIDYAVTHIFFYLFFFSKTFGDIHFSCSLWSYLNTSIFSFHVAFIGVTCNITTEAITFLSF